MSQSITILNEFKKAKGGWINGRYFLQTLMLSQYHARIKELQEQRYQIEASDFKDEYGFKSYRLISEPTTEKPDIESAIRKFTLNAFSYKNGHDINDRIRKYRKIQAENLKRAGKLPPLETKEIERNIIFQFEGGVNK